MIYFRVSVPRLMYFFELFTGEFTCKLSDAVRYSFVLPCVGEQTIRTMAKRDVEIQKCLGDDETELISPVETSPILYANPEHVSPPFWSSGYVCFHSLGRNPLGVYLQSASVRYCD